MRLGTPPHALLETGHQPTVEAAAPRTLQAESWRPYRPRRISASGPCGDAEARRPLRLPRMASGTLRGVHSRRLHLRLSRTTSIGTIPPEVFEDVGRSVCTGGFTSEAQREARAQEKRRIVLVDDTRLVELWTEHYERLDEIDRQRLPLTRIYFLVPADSGRTVPLGQQAGSKRLRSLGSTTRLRPKLELRNPMNRGIVRAPSLVSRSGKWPVTPGSPIRVPSLPLKAACK